MKVILTPLSMRVPNSKGIYAPSRLESEKTMSIDEFEKYTSKQILVSFEEDGISNPCFTYAYGYGLGCWYLANLK